MKQILCADLFCGGGGTSTGMIAAFEKNGIDYELVGVNHWDKAIETNNLNHRGRYYRDGVERVSPRELVPGGRLHILCASPECTNHSKAKGKRPKDEQSRATAWDVLKWPQELYIDRIYIENVEEFLDWGPCDEEGYPVASMKGKTFRAYINAFKSLGYRVDWQMMNAADFGAPTCRRRLIIQAVRGKSQKIRWPEPTHAKNPGLFEEKPWRAAREVINKNLRGKSIFNRPAPMAANTLRRVYSGMVKNGGEYTPEFCYSLRAEIVRSYRYRREHPRKGDTDFQSNKKLQKEERDRHELAYWRKNCPFSTLRELPKVERHNRLAPFITVMRGTNPATDAASVKTLDEPLMTISTRGHEGFCTPFVTRYNGGDDRNHMISAPVPVVDCSNRYALIEPFIFAMGQTSAGSRSTNISSPISTIVTKAEHCIVEPMIAARRFDNVPVSVDCPCQAIVTTGNLDLVEPMVISHKFNNVPISVLEPLQTLTTVNGFSLAEPMIVSLRGTGDGNINRSAISVKNPLPTVTTSGTHHYLAEPLVIDMSHPAEDSAARVRSATGQLPTITTRNNLAVSVPFLVPFFGESQNQVPRTHSITEPLPTVTSHGAGGIVEPMFIPQHGGGTVKPVSLPLSTIATTGSISIVSPFLVKFYGNEKSWCSIDCPLDTVTCKDRFGIASGRLFVDQWGNLILIDIDFRMLEPEELSLAMSFPEDYIFAGTKSDQVKQIGNAVCPALAEALITAALDDLEDVLKQAA